MNVQLFTPLKEADEASKIVLHADYAIQPKFNGKRIQLHVANGKVTAYNRKGKPCPISDLTATEAKKFNNVLFDGELIRTKYYAFDILESSGVNLTLYPFKDRIDYLTAYLSSYENQFVELSPTETETNRKVLLVEKLKELAFEGFVAKKLSAPYLDGRQKDQYKFKFEEEGSFIVIGFNQKDSVQVGLIDDTEIVNCGNVKIRNDRFKEQLKIGDVIDVIYMHAFKDSGHIYQPRMTRIRTDIAPQECVISQLKYLEA